MGIPPSRIRIYADESINVAIVERLKRRGVKAFSAKDLAKLGLTDEEQLETAIQQKAVILTNDSDFVRISARKKHTGIIYVHQDKLTIGECIQRLKIITETRTAEQMKNQLIFV